MCPLDYLTGNLGQMEEVNVAGNPLPVSALAIALQELLEARLLFNQAKRNADEKKKKYLALGGTLDRADLGPRNARIYEQHKVGKSAKELGEIFKLSEDWVRGIVARGKFMEQKRKR